MLSRALWGCLGLAAAVCSAALFAVRREPAWNFETSTVLLTGGSAGIGLETAKALVKKRVKFLVIAARRERQLKEAVEALKQLANSVHSSTKVFYIVMDVCSDESVIRGVAEARRVCGEDISLLICNAGFASPMRFLDSSVTHAEGMMQTNYLGSLRLMWAVMPSMIRKKKGRVVLTSSLAAVAPIAGYTLYAGSKAAMRATAHSVDMENSCLGVRVQVVSPPDVQTPGFDEENEVKSPECKAISEMGGPSVFTADAMAKKIIAGIEHYRFDITLGLDGFVLSRTVACMEPASSLLHLLFESLFTGPLRLALAVYARLHYNIVYRIRVTDGK